MTDAPPEMQNPANPGGASRNQLGGCLRNNDRDKAVETQQLQQVALAILTSGIQCTRKAGSFLGQCIADPKPLTLKQAEWFTQLAEKAGVDWEIFR